MFRTRVYWILFFICFSFKISAQFNFGVKTALTLSFAKTENLLFDDPFDYLLYEVMFEDEDVSPTFGLFASLKEDNLYLQSEVLYRNITSNFNYIIWETNPPKTNAAAKRTHFIAVPVMGGVLVDRFKLGVGPVFSFILSENEIFEEFKHFEERREWLEAGFAFNLGVQLLRLNLDFRYELHFNRVADYFVFNQLQAGFGQSPAYLSIGLSYIIR